MIASGLRPGALRRAVPSAALALVATLLTGCSGDEGDAAPAPSTATTGTPSAEPEPSAAESGEAEPSADPADALPPVHSATSLPALMRERLTGGRITRVRQQAVTDAYTRWEVTYPSGDLTVSGVLLVPNGEGPFPGIVLNHGYIEPSIYVTGQGLAREQDWLARAGFVVLHTAYQGHAASDAATPLARETRLGYTRDTINAVQSLKRLPKVDPDRVAMLGRSMGGGVTYNALVAKPGLVRAAVVYAPVSSRFLDNLARWTLPERPEAAQALYDRFGTPRAVLPRAVRPHLLRPDHRAGADPPRHVRRQLPDPVVPDHAGPAPPGRRPVAARGLRGRGARVRPALGGLDPHHGRVPAPAAGLIRAVVPSSRCGLGD